MSCEPGIPYYGLLGSIPDGCLLRWDRNTDLYAWVPVGTVS